MVLSSLKEKLSKGENLYSNSCIIIYCSIYAMATIPGVCKKTNLKSLSGFVKRLIVQICFLK